MNNAIARLTKNVAYFLILILLSITITPTIVFAQTTLNKGDFAVVGINTNNNSVCAGAATTDLISFVCFKQIETNTVLDLTDNGWERTTPGLFGDTEGVLRATYTGAVPIPPGEVITFLGINVPEVYQSPSHPGVWSFQNISGANPMNLNNGGDQIFFMQDGEWDIGTGALHDASYSGRILFGFNSRSIWEADGSTTQSNLHPEVSDCFHMEPSSGQSDFLKYTGPMNAATQLEWISRISDASNWSAFPNCDAYNTAEPDYPAPVTLPLAPSGMFIECTVCTGCGTVNDTLVFNLPETGGPFMTVYTDGQDTFNLTDIENGTLVPITITMDTEVTYISVTDANGCPVFSNFEGGAIITLEDGPIIDNPGNQTACSSFILPAITGSNLSADISYYTASGGMGVQFAPNDEITTTTTLFIYDDFLGCEAEVSFEITITNDIPEIDPISDQTICEAYILPEIIGTNLTGSQAYYDEPNGMGTQFLPGEQILQNTILFAFDGSEGCSDEESFEIVILPLPELALFSPQNISCIGAQDGAINFDLSGNGPFDLDWNVDALDGLENPTNLGPGTYELTVTDNNGCIAEATFEITEPTAISLNCGEVNPVSVEGGMDGLAEVELNGGTAPYDLSWTGPTIGQSMVDAGTIPIPNLAAGIYEVLIVDNNGCEATCSFSISDPGCTLTVGPNANNPDCEGDLSGSIDLVLAGGEPPFTFDWSDDTFDGQEDPINVPPGIYTVTVSDAGSCNIVETVSVLAPEALEIFTRIQAPVCFGENSGFIIIDSIVGGVAPFQFQLDGGPAVDIPGLPFPIGDLVAGTYDFSIQDANSCEQNTSIDIPSPPNRIVTLEPELFIDFGDSVEIRPVANFIPNTVVWNPNNFLTTPDSLITFARPLETVTYNLLAQDTSGCSATASITINVERNREIFIPNVFSPNGDGRNDRFAIFTGKEVAGVSTLQIFDRWGGQVFVASDFIPNDESLGWDGTYRGEPVNTGVYTYFAEIEFLDGQTEIWRGTVAVLR